MKQRCGWPISSCSQYHRRGVALLLVLACVVVTLPICVGIASYAGVAQTHRRLNDWTMIADDLCRCAEHGPIRHWLEHEASNVVLPPGNTTPRVEVLHDRLVIPVESDRRQKNRGIDCELTITAWDQCGMVSLGHARAGSPLRLTLPSEVTSIIDRKIPTGSNRESFGLDMLISNCSPSAPTRGSLPATAIFPRAGGGAVMLTTSFSAANGPTMSDERPRSGGRTTTTHARQRPSDRDALPAVGSSIATHQPGGRSGQISINTAPLHVVETAMMMAGRGGLELIVDARAKGRQAQIVSLPTTSTGSDIVATTAPRLVASSDAWAFRIDARVGTVHRSWWVVMVATGIMKPGSSWEVVQRLLIDS